MMSKQELFAVALLALGGAIAAPIALAGEGPKLEVQASDSLQSVLSKLAGKRVQLMLAGGGELGGVVSSVNDHVLLLTDITGKEFYDAVVSLDKVSAVTVRGR